MQKKSCNVGYAKIPEFQKNRSQNPKNPEICGRGSTTRAGAARGSRGWGGSPAVAAKLFASQCINVLSPAVTVAYTAAWRQRVALRVALPEAKCLISLG